MEERLYLFPICHHNGIVLMSSEGRSSFCLSQFIVTLASSNFVVAMSIFQL